MSNMEDLKEKAAGAALSAAKTAKFVASVSKKHMEIAMEKERIRKIYAKLGKIYYKDYITDEEPDEAEYRPLCESISESFRRINELKDEIAEAKEEYFDRKSEEEEIIALEEATEE
ncbi:MAG: hypothetical protein E7434_02340 [Ruminococcaceae bacterium]|nr:hypothetical protein [Oscillospiraceae bacterium]